MFSNSKTTHPLAQDNNVRIKDMWTSTLYHPDDLSYNNPKVFTDVFTQFRVTLEKQNIRVRRLINIPSTFKSLPNDSIITLIPNLTDFGYSNVIINPNSVFPFEGGELSGLTHLQKYIWEKNLAPSYKQTRNSLTGSENSTKFSPWFDPISLQSLIYI
ncbi:unnamed protein product [Rotaria sp. Silwood2]|nr:unnamed protein product [Rotaria sp. Silwood2]